MKKLFLTVLIAAIAICNVNSQETMPAKNFEADYKTNVFKNDGKPLNGKITLTNSGKAFVSGNFKEGKCLDSIQAFNVSMERVVDVHFYDVSGKLILIKGYTYPSEKKVLNSLTEYSYKDTDITEVFKMLNADGSVASFETRLNGKQNGESKYFKGSQLVQHFTYDNGNLTSRIEFWDDGKNKEESKFCLMSGANKYLPCGTSKKWYPNGQLSSTRTVNDKSEVIKEMKYTKEGKVKEETKYDQNGNGTEITYFENGKIKKKMTYVNRQVKKYDEYDETGKVIKTKTY